MSEKDLRFSFESINFTMNRCGQAIIVNFDIPRYVNYFIKPRMSYYPRQSMFHTKATLTNLWDKCYPIKGSVLKIGNSFDSTIRQDHRPPVMLFALVQFPPSLTCIWRLSNVPAFHGEVAKW